MTENQEIYIADLLSQANEVGVDVYDIEGEFKRTVSVADAISMDRASEIIDELKELIHEAGL